MLIQVLLIVLLAAGVAGFFWFLAKTSADRIAKQYRALSKRFTLELTISPPQLGGFNRPEPFVHGHYRKREMSISAPGRGLQSTRQTETSIKIKVMDRNIEFQMTASGFLSTFKQRGSSGLEQWTSGDGMFDSAIRIKTNDPERLSRILNQDRRDALKVLLKKSKSTLYLAKGVLVYDEVGLIADDKTRVRIEGTVEELFSLAELVDGR